VTFFLDKLLEEACRAKKQNKQTNITQFMGLLGNMASHDCIKYCVTRWNITGQCL